MSWRPKRKLHRFLRTTGCQPYPSTSSPTSPLCLSGRPSAYTLLPVTMLTGGGGAALGHLRQRPTLLAEAPPHVTACAHARSLSLYNSFPIAPTAVAAQRCLRQTPSGIAHSEQMGSGRFSAMILRPARPFLTSGSLPQSRLQSQPQAIPMAIIISHGNQNKSLKSPFKITE